MTFGQQAGPPATSKQLQELLGLLQDAGHLDFRDARGPMGFNQRQAGGRFTRDEADAYIEQLRDDAPAEPAARLSATEMALRRFADGDLAAELQRRGWIVMEPG